MLLATFAGRNAPYDIRAIVDHVLRMKRTSFTRETLNDDTRTLIY
jgi:hypothetical protein